MNQPALVLSLLVATSFAAHAAEQAIELETKTGTIKGTLTLPSASSQVPVVLLIAGSGPTNRNGNAPVAAGRNDSLKMLAASLADLGVASVRYDKRGIAASSAAGPAESDLRFDNYVQDAASWVTKLARDSRFHLIHHKAQPRRIMCSVRLGVLARSNINSVSSERRWKRWLKR